MAVLEVDVQAALNAPRDDPCPIAEWRGRGELGTKDQSDAIRAAQVEVVADDLLEEPPSPPGRLIEDLGQADLDLPQAQPMAVADRACRGIQAPGQSLHPAGRRKPARRPGQCIADVLQPFGIGAPAEAVVRGGEGDAVLPQQLLGPRVAVQAHADRVGQVAADLDEG